MEIIKVRLPSDYTLVINGDNHLGSPNVNEDHIKEMVEHVATTKNCFLTNIGDNVEAITPNDKRFAFSDTKYQTTQQQAKAFIKLMKPIKKKMMVVGIGNHEIKLMNSYDVAKDICDSLGTRWGGYCYKLEMYDYNTEKLMHKLYFTHGYGSITSNAKDDIQIKANMDAALKRKLCMSGHSDVIAMYMGHIHRFILVEPTIHNKLQLTTENGKIKQHYRTTTDQTATEIPPEARWFSSTGSMMKTYASANTGYISYAEMAGYAPAELGYLIQTVENGKIVKVERVIL